MAKETYTSREAALALGVSIDTVRNWDRSGKIRAERTAVNRLVIPASEVERLRGDEQRGTSARNRLPGVLRYLQFDGILAQIELDLIRPARVVAVITRDAAEDLGLRPGAMVSAVVEETSVIIER